MQHGKYLSDSDPRWSHLSDNAKGTPTQAEKIAEDAERRARRTRNERFVRLTHQLTGEPAWRALGAQARDAYMLLARRARFNKRGACVNNGKLPMGVRELAEDMGASRTTAHLMLVRLQLFGFIVDAWHGHFGDRSGARRSTCWRLTEYGTPDGVATRDYQTIKLRDAERAYREREAKLRGREKNRVTPRVTQKACASPHGVRTRHPTGDTDPISVHGFGHVASPHGVHSREISPGQGASGASGTLPSSPVIRLEDALTSIRARRRQAS